MKISPQALAFVRACMVKLNEKSSVYAYLMLFAGLFAKGQQGDIAQASAIISSTAGIVLFVLNDTQVRKYLTGQKPADAPAPTEPNPPTETKP